LYSIIFSRQIAHIVPRLNKDKIALTCKKVGDDKSFCQYDTVNKA